MNRPIAILSLVLLGSALQGCVIYDDDHHHHFHDDPVFADLRVYWEFRGGLDCFEADVGAILIEVEGFGRVDEFGFVDCHLGFVDIPGDFPTARAFRPGTYHVTVFGFPPRDAPANWVAEGRVELFPGSNDYTFRLSPFF